MKIKEIMNKKPLTIDQGKNALDATKEMNRVKKEEIIVVDENKKLLGIITERDLINKVMVKNKKVSDVNVKSIMTRNLITINQDKEATEALFKMRKSSIRKIPVLDSESNLVGIITDFDLAYAIELIDILEKKLSMSVIPNKVDSEIIEDNCQICGNFDNNLKKVEGKWICENCRDETNGNSANYE